MIMKKSYLLGLAILLATGLYSCKKHSSSESVNISTPQLQIGKLITSDTLTGSVYGTLQSGKTYYFKGQVTIPLNDTLVIQSGVKLLGLDTTSLFVVHGAFVSLGSETAPNYITGVAGINMTKPTTVVDPSVDPAFKAQWGGIQGQIDCQLIDIKWTHMDYVGGSNGTTPLAGYSAGDALFGIIFQNSQGYLIVEDSWWYGTTTDCIRVLGGKFHLMRNTIEKMALNDGDAFNIKNAGVGDMAYNIFVGTAKNGQKVSNKGTYGSAVEANVVMYNCTFVNGGYRSIDPARGASIDYEQNAEGKAYNHLMVNCRYGLRIVGNPVADTANCFYGNSFNYGDSLSVVDQFYPQGYVTKPMNTDIPAPFGTGGLFTSQYNMLDSLGEVYGAPIKFAQANNPQFVNFPLPMQTAHLRDINFVGNYNFRLTSTSPCIGKGTTAVQALNMTAAVSNPYLKATITPPSKDIGAYPTDGTGNQH
jgi:hypothetical protein